MKIDQYRRGRNFIRVGDTVKVKPSRKGKQDGFLGTVREIHSEEDTVTRVDVFGANGARVPSMRSFTPERIQRVAQARRRKTNGA